jgi:signal transduction histidine kinase
LINTTYFQIPNISGRISFTKEEVSAIISRFKRCPPQYTLSAEQKGKEWVCSFRDDGIGIPREDAKKRFNIFQLLLRDRYPGTGIGLATCKKIIEGMAGLYG